MSLLNKRFVVFIASHIDIPVRMLLLTKSAESFLGKVKVRTSVSYEPEYEAFVKKYLSDYEKKKTPSIEFFLHPARKSQFQHFDYLANSIPDLKCDVVILFDDDDLAPPNIIENYEACYSNNPKPKAVYRKNKIKRTYGLTPGTISNDPFNKNTFYKVLTYDQHRQINTAPCPGDLPGTTIDLEDFKVILETYKDYLRAGMFDCFLRVVVVPFTDTDIKIFKRIWYNPKSWNKPIDKDITLSLAGLVGLN